LIHGKRGKNQPTVYPWGSIGRRQETGDRRQETGDRRQETGDRRQETGDRRQEIYSLWRSGVPNKTASQSPGNLLVDLISPLRG